MTLSVECFSTERADDCGSLTVQQTFGPFVMASSAEESVCVRDQSHLGMRKAYMTQPSPSKRLLSDDLLVAESHQLGALTRLSDTTTHLDLILKPLDFLRPRARSNFLPLEAT